MMKDQFMIAMIVTVAVTRNSLTASGLSIMEVLIMTHRTKLLASSNLIERLIRRDSVHIVNARCWRILVQLHCLFVS